MESSAPPTIEQFYKYCSERKLMGVKCRKCRTILVPPRNVCPHCYSSGFDWIQLSGRGKLLTYTIIHAPPAQFQAMAPYAVGIVKLEEGVQLPGMIKSARLEDIKIGMDLVVDFETATPKVWPQWPRYYFKQL